MYSFHCSDEKMAALTAVIVEKERDRVSAEQNAAQMSDRLSRTEFERDEASVAIEQLKRDHATTTLKSGAEREQLELVVRNAERSLAALRADFDAARLDWANQTKSLAASTAAASDRDREHQHEVMEQQMTDERERHEEAQREWRSKLSHAEQRISELMAELSSVRAQRSTLEREKAEATDFAEKCQSDTKLLDSQFVILKSAAHTVNEQLSEAKARLAELESAQRQWQQQLSSSTNELKAKDRSIAELRERHTEQLRTALATEQRKWRLKTEATEADSVNKLRTAENTIKERDAQLAALWTERKDIEARATQAERSLLEVPFLHPPVRRSVPSLNGFYPRRCDVGSTNCLISCRRCRRTRSGKGGRGSSGDPQITAAAT